VVASISGRYAYTSGSPPAKFQYFRGPQAWNNKISPFS
jgi:hypothetical protein